MRKTAQIAWLSDATVGDHDFDVNVTVEGQSVTVIPSLAFFDFLQEHYYEWSYFSNSTDLTGWYNDLKDKFTQYSLEFMDVLTSIYEALQAKYDPSSNFSRHEQASHKNERTIGYGKSVTTDYGDDGLETTINYGHVVTDKTTTFDNTATLRPATETIYSDYNGISGTDPGGDIHTVKGTVTNESSGEDTITDVGLKADNQRDIEGLQRATAAENIQKEIDMRLKNDFFDIAVEEFVKRYLFLLA